MAVTFTYSKHAVRRVFNDGLTNQTLQAAAALSYYSILSIFPALILLSAVMAYIPPNIWPKGTPNGAYWQTALGPYDYYAIHWGYATVPDAKTPELEIPTLRQWSSKWLPATTSRGARRRCASGGRSSMDWSGASAFLVKRMIRSVSLSRMRSDPT